MTSINWNGPNRDYGVVNFDRGDNDLVVNIYWRSVHDADASERAGAPVFTSTEYIKMFRPGEMMNQIDRPLRADDKVRFKQYWDNFQLQKAQVPEGTPIDLLFPNNPAIADTLRGYGIYTIQQLANLTAHAVDSVGMGGQEYVNKAKKYLEAATSGKEVVKMQEDMRRMARELERAEANNATLKQQVDALIVQMRKGSGVDASTNTMVAGDDKGIDPLVERINATQATNTAPELAKYKKK